MNRREKIKNDKLFNYKYQLHKLAKSFIHSSKINVPNFINSSKIIVFP